MKYYQVIKINSRTEEKSNYGINSEDDMKAITKGYQQDKSTINLYNQKNSKFFFIIEEV